MDTVELASVGGARSNTVTSAVRLTFTVFSLTSGGCFSFLSALSFFLVLDVVGWSEPVSLVVLVAFTVSSEPASTDSVRNKNMNYRIAGKFDGELNLAVWRSAFTTTKFKSANISYSYIYVWRSLTEPPNLNPPIFLQWQFWPQPPNLIPTNISVYTVPTSTKNVLI